MVNQAPFMISMFRNWILASKGTPFIVIIASEVISDADIEAISKNNELVLNVSHEAVNSFDISQEGDITVVTRLKGQSVTFNFASTACKSIYCMENGMGTILIKPKAATSDNKGDSDKIPQKKAH